MYVTAIFKIMSSSLSQEQKTFIILKYGETKDFGTIRRAFATKFYPKHPRLVPSLQVFRRLVVRFCATGSLQKKKPTGRKGVSDETIARVKEYFEMKETESVRNAAADLQLSYGVVHRILKKKLGWKPYRPHRTVCLSPAHIHSRLSACNFWVQFPEEWFERIIWTDEKMFVLIQAPHRQNDRIWAPISPNKVIECKKTSGSKCMAWTGIIDGKCLPVIWIEGSLNGEEYLKILQNTLWPSVRASATRKMYWYQQDGAPCHVSSLCLDFLKSKFGDRILSRNCENHWPANSPDLSPMDFSFWNQASEHLRSVRPETLDDMKRAVEDFAINLDEVAIRKMCRHARKRALACIEAGGGHFEHLMK